MDLKLNHIKYTDNVKIMVDKFNDMMSAVYEGIATVKEQQFTSTGQTMFTLLDSYQVGGNLIEVFVNGDRKLLGTHYEETSEKVITFTELVPEGHLVYFRWIAPTGQILIGDIQLDNPELMPDNYIPESKVDLVAVKKRIDDIEIGAKDYTDAEVAKIDVSGYATSGALTDHADTKASALDYGHVKIGTGLEVEDGVISVQVPEVPEMVASGVSIQDVNDYYVSTNLEGAMQEIGQSISGASGIMVNKINEIAQM